MKISKDYDTLTIVGCGLVGSTLAYNIGSLGIFKKLILIDHDIIQEKNLPYLTKGISKKVCGVNKTVVLKSILEDLYENIVIQSTKYDKTTNSKMLEGISFDCRDNKDVDINFDIKLNMDGEYGKITFIKGYIKEDISNDETSQYQYETNKLLSYIFTSLVAREVFYEGGSISKLQSSKGSKSHSYITILSGHNSGKFIDIT